MAPDGPESWPKEDSHSQWLVFYRLDQMTLTGKGTIEGNGEQWWDLPCKPHRVIIASESYNNSYTILLFVVYLFNAERTQTKW